MNAFAGCVESVEGVKEENKIFFEERFIETDVRRPMMDGISFLQFSVEEKIELKVEFSMEDVRGVV